MKKILLTGFIAMSAMASFAQKGFMHHVGASYILRMSDVSDEFGYKSRTGAPAVSYSPRYNVWGTESMTLSVGSHVDLGFSISANSIYGTSGYFFAGIPVVAELNFGRGSSRENDSKVGGFVGAGFEYMFAAGGGASENIYGPTAQAGFTFRVVEETLGIRASYMKELKGFKSNIIGVGVFYVIPPFR